MMMLKVSLTAYLCILGSLLAPATAQQFRYPLPTASTQQSTTTTTQAQNPWGLRPLPARRPTAPYQNPQQYQPPYYPPHPPPPPTYLPSQLNPPQTGQGSNPYYPQPNPNYAPPSPTYSPPASTSSSDVWSSWKNIGGAFRYYPGADNAGGNGDIVAAINSMGVLKVKSVGTSASTSWITLAQPVSSPSPDPPESSPAVVVSSSNFQVFVVSVLGTVYRLTAAAQLPVNNLLSGSWTAIGSITAINDPAATLVGSYYFIFVIHRSNRNMFYASVSSANVATSFAPVEATPSKTFIFSPTASTYTNNGGNRIVIAGVDFGGTLLVGDTTAVAADPDELTAVTFYATDVSCIDSPESVSLGTSVEIYCRGKDMNFYCVTITQGGIGDTRILPEADIPSSYKPVYNSQTRTVSVYSKTPAGRIVSKVFQSYQNTQQYMW